MLRMPGVSSCIVFPPTDPRATALYTLSLHDALPISTSGRTAPTARSSPRARCQKDSTARAVEAEARAVESFRRSEEHTSELQSRQYLVCRLLLGKKKKRVQHHQNRQKDG